jgi:anti-sigma regulatory factor (Ser/Thr protein kinase)
VNHVVHFYEGDDERADSVVRYLTDAIRSSALAGQGTAGAARDGFGPHPAVADQRSFPAERNSVRAARHYVTGLLGEGADEAAACDTAIVATELAANAVLHARTGFTLTVSRSAGVTRIAVRDSTPVGLLSVTRPEAAGEGVPFQAMRGHGLSVVAQLASRWAVEPLPDGKVVWAELRAPRQEA